MSRHLCDHGEAQDEEADAADQGEDWLMLPQVLGELVRHGGHDGLDSGKLGAVTNRKYTQNFFHSPEGVRPLKLSLSKCLVKVKETATGRVTMVSRPRVSSMRKKMMAQNGDRGSRVRASGYTTKAMPGPDTHTTQSDFL